MKLRVQPPGIALLLLLLLALGPAGGRVAAQA